MSLLPAAERYAVLGNPVAHSQSPFIHAEFARQTGQPVEYTRVLCAMDGFAEAVRAFAASGGRGCNVTVPFKFQSSALAAQVTPRATLARAANLLRFDAGGWLADNTDGVGLVRDIERNADFRLQGRRVLLIGAGGAAAGVLGPLIEARPARLHVANRTPDKAAALVERHAALAQQLGVALSSSGLDDAGVSYDLVLNSSASSLGGAAVPVSSAVLQPGALAVDLMYGAAALPFMAWARSLGAVPRDGLGMLVEQAAEAFFVWRGIMPDSRPVLRRLREHLANAAHAP
ncbi:MAG TPA: shikimate dehydrogenase [Rubrivivax sp.]|nr:shikimate dehydrogenase [Rubrivivax sp.]